MDTLQLLGNVELLELVQDFVRQRVDPLAPSNDLIHEMRLVVEELFTNIALYAYPNKPGEVRVGCCMDPEGLFCVRFMDWGIPFNPLACEPPDLERDFSDREIGGLGIHLVKQLVQTIHYTREGDSNVLTVCFQVREE